MSRAEEILSRKRRPLAPLVVSEWGDGLFVCAIKASNLVALDELAKVDTAAGRLAFSMRLITMGVADAEGRPVFSVDDEERLKEEEAEVIARVVKQVRDFNGMTENAVEEEKKS